MNFDFANPEFLWALLLLPILAILRSASGKRASITFSSVAVASVAARKNKSKAGFIKFSLTMEKQYSIKWKSIDFHFSGKS